MNDKLPGSLFRSDDIERGKDLLYVDDGLVWLVGPGYGQLKVLTAKEIGGDILQLQCGQLCKRIIKQSTHYFLLLSKGGIEREKGGGEREREREREREAEQREWLHHTHGFPINMCTHTYHLPEAAVWISS